jgi:hypothetical protein
MAGGTPNPKNGPPQFNLLGIFRNLRRAHPGHQWKQYQYSTHIPQNTRRLALRPNHKASLAGMGHITPLEWQPGTFQVTPVRTNH